MSERQIPAAEIESIIAQIRDELPRYEEGSEKHGGRLFELDYWTQKLAQARAA